MPKVMMIGKVSKLKSRTRRAGSFKGSLGTVVLEGSRAQSRRYGMGNIAGRYSLRGTPEQHAKFAQSTFTLARETLASAKAQTACADRAELAGAVLRNVGAVESALVWAAGAVPYHDLHQVADAAQAMITACASRPATAKKAKSAKPAKKAKSAKRRGAR